MYPVDYFQYLHLLSFCSKTLKISDKNKIFHGKPWDDVGFSGTYVKLKVKKKKKMK